MWQAYFFCFKIKGPDDVRQVLIRTDLSAAKLR
ncbi:hypothetical protein BBR47_16550 [Brevibacillus brevis NBRC 100599]|uniref:Uncharacterized protein n=1 Tax=Brevibacillus brevis (strain 47 / JCM 6285 / NBRC 100599) TaxID=358681 RepID=C0Z9G2_BREBN|nr:hypothetical protein BBR47_16550 [Brevibacillus brevis NBRC 100599]